VRTPSRLLAGVATALLLAGCGGTLPAGAAAVVNGEQIPRDRLEAAVREATGDVEALSAEEREAQVGSQQRQILTFLIQDKVLASAAAEQGIELTDEDLAAAREQVLTAVGGEEQLDLALAQAGLSRELFEEVIVPQEARVTALRAALLGGQALETRTARHILVETQQEADEIVAELQDGGDFAAIAGERSQDPGSGAAGGDLGPAPRGQYVPEFEEAVWGASLGEVVGPVETQFGFHIIEVTALDEIPAEELSPQQADQLVGSRLNELVQAAFEEAEITVGAGLGEWDPAARQVVPEGQVGQGTPGEPAGG
jgi:parvulin-like peptidyl-prolyl isomerase